MERYIELRCGLAGLQKEACRETRLIRATWGHAGGRTCCSSCASADLFDLWLAIQGSSDQKQVLEPGQASRQEFGGTSSIKASTNVESSRIVSWTRRLNTRIWIPYCLCMRRDSARGTPTTLAECSGSRSEQSKTRRVITQRRAESTTSKTSRQPRRNLAKGDTRGRASIVAGRDAEW